MPLSGGDAGGGTGEKGCKGNDAASFMPEHASIFTFYTKDMKSQIQHERCTQEIWEGEEKCGERERERGRWHEMYLCALCKCASAADSQA